MNLSNAVLFPSLQGMVVSLEGLGEADNGVIFPCFPLRTSLSCWQGIHYFQRNNFVNLFWMPWPKYYHEYPLSCITS